MCHLLAHPHAIVLLAGLDFYPGLFVFSKIPEKSPLSSIGHSLTFGSWINALWYLRSGMDKGLGKPRLFVYSHGLFGYSLVKAGMSMLAFYVKVESQTPIAYF